MVATCSRGQGLRAGEEIPLADVTVVGEGGHGDARDVLRVHHGKHAVAGRVHDLPRPDGVAPGEGVGREGAGPQVGHAKAGLAQDLLASREGGPHRVGVQRQQARAGGREQHNPRHHRVLRGGDHRLGLLGPGSDVHQEDGLGAGDRFGHACGVVEITGGKLDTRRQAGRPEGARTNARTLWPCSCSCRATAPPTWPVAPVTRYIFSPFQIGGDYQAPRWTGPRA